MELKFKCDGDKSFISLDTMVKFTGKRAEDLTMLSYKAGHGKTFTIDGTEFKVYITTPPVKKVRKVYVPKTPPKNYWIKVDEKKTGYCNRKLFVKDQINFDERGYRGRKFYIDGKKTTIDEIAKILEVSPYTIYGALNNAKSVTINDHKIRIEPTYKLYVLIKDGVRYEPKRISECCEITKLKEKTIYDLTRSGLYTKQEGWRCEKYENN